MKSLNQVSLIGHVGKDAETRYTPAGTAVTEFSMATSEKWKDKTTGEDKERTEWHTIVLWSKLAEIAGEFVKKGMPLYVQGSIRTDKYEKEGQTHYRVKIHADNMIFLGKSEDRPKPARQQPQEQPKPAPKTAAETDPFDDDIPF